jgi:hypothetical protein
MKKSELQHIIREEIRKVLIESTDDQLIKSLEQKKLIDHSKKTINLGLVNSWNTTYSKFHEDLSKLTIPKTYKATQQGRSYTKYQYDVTLNGETYTVFYSADSSD